MHFCPLKLFSMTKHAVYLNVGVLISALSSLFLAFLHRSSFVFQSMYFKIRSHGFKIYSWSETFTWMCYIISEQSIFQNVLFLNKFKAEIEK